MQNRATKKAKQNGGAPSSKENPKEACVNLEACVVGEVAPERLTYIARLFCRVKQALEDLKVDFAKIPNHMTLIENTAIFIHESMSASSRNYHSVQHVFDVADGHGIDGDPIIVLSALFHDCVYYHVDGGLSDEQYAILKGVVSCDPVEEKDDDDDTDKPIGVYGRPLHDHPVHTAHTKPGDRLLALVETVFGYEKGVAVSHSNGLNEFLSAVIAVRSLKEFLPRPILAQIACCIELTIPFRAPNKQTGETCTERCFRNMMTANKDFDLGMTEEECVVAVQRGVIMAHSDVANFGEDDVLWFLDNTWSLLPELNESLRHKYMYTAQQMQEAVFKTRGFFHFLSPPMVFASFRNVPTKELHEQRISNTGRNLDLGRKYTAAKLVSTSVISAFAQLSGGDAPISLFLGDLPNRRGSVQRSGLLESMMTMMKEEEELGDDDTPHCDPVVYEVLTKGRRSETAFDIKRSPLAAYFYDILGDAETAKVLSDVKVYPMTDEAAWALLRRLPRFAVEEVGLRLGHSSFSRGEKILKTIQQL